jgi:hypothetical protein
MELKFTDDDLRLVRQSEALLESIALADLDDRRLQQISRSMGIDFATVLLYQAIRSSPDHGPSIQRMEAILSESSTPCAVLDTQDAIFAVVPGAFYREHAETGADGERLRRVAASLGYDTRLVPTKSTGGAAQNGRIVCDWLREHSNRKTVLCSLSKGSADMKMALADPAAPKAFRYVVAWLNVGGIPFGSPMVSWLLEHRLLSFLYRAIFWCRGQDFAFVREMQRGIGGALDLDVAPPAQLKIIHVMGFPLARHVRQRCTRNWHRRIARYGPNDGAAILADSCRLPGRIFPVWGADHYFDSVMCPEVLLEALLRLLSEELGNTETRGQSQNLVEDAAVP